MVCCTLAVRSLSPPGYLQAASAQTSNLVPAARSKSLQDVRESVSEMKVSA